MEQSREKFASRLGFILISAGCAIGLGNVYRFPIITGAYGGGVFVLIYIAFLVLLGLPIMSAELAVGRGSQRSIASSFDVLEKKGQKWHLMIYLGIGGNYLLMMFYTVISGWMVIYFVKYLTGSIMGASGVEGLSAVFGNMVSDPGLMVVSAFAVILICFGICSMGLQKGVEGITKWMMVALLALMIGLAVYSATLPNAAEGLRFYLVPSLKRLEEAGVSTVISAAMGQSFFTLSLGIGSIAIFGSYIGKEHALLGESVRIVILDTFVAVTAGLIIFPACFTYGVDQTSGPSLIFITLPNIFAHMAMGRLWGSLFFLFMSFAALSTVLAVFENIICCGMELTGCSRMKSSAANFVLITLLSIPCVLGYNVWSWDGFAIFGGAVLDFEDFLVSNLLLPIGSLIYLLFCVTRWGWGFDNYLTEANTGKGLRLPRWFKPYFSVVLPLLIVFILVQGL